MAGAHLPRMSDFRSLLIQAAQEEGFPLAGALDIDSVLGPSPIQTDLKSGDSSPNAGAFREHIQRYDQWIAKGYEGAMEYLRRGRDRRADPRLVFPRAQSVLCVAMPYPVAPAGNTDPSQGPRYARYIRRKDYHDDIAERLERVMQNVRARWSSSALQWKVCVDTSAVLERSWAALAGLGWIGKNTLLIHPQYGSYLFLGEVLISEKTGHGPQPIKNYCGNCTRCLSSCPSQAFEKAGTLDSNRCIAYWTLEKRGALEISPEQKSSIGTWIAGCDVCQEVCPFNTKPTKAAELEPKLTEIGATSLQTWKELLDETTEDYKSRIRDSSLSRVKPAQFSRNLAISLANAIAADPRSSWVDSLRPAIQRRLANEADPVARAEWVRCAIIAGVESTETFS